MGKNGIAHPTGVIELPLSQVSVFSSGFVINASTRCWEWRGKLSPQGYGMYYIRPRLVRVHRAMYELVTGKIIDSKLVIDHLCRVRHCVNPKHLEVVTNRENVLRGQGSTAINARKTICKHGHDITGDNVYITNQGNRFCNDCKAYKPSTEFYWFKKPPRYCPYCRVCWQVRSHQDYIKRRDKVLANRAAYRKSELY